MPGTVHPIRLDAMVIARYGAFACPAPTPVLGGAQQVLAELLGYRRQLLAEITARTQQLNHLRTPALIARAKAALERLHQDKAELDALLRQTIAEDAKLAAMAALLGSTPGVGPVLIATLLAELPELGAPDRRRITSLVGLAPVANDSGQMRGRRVIQGGRSTVRRALYMAVLSASRGRSRFAVSYRALVAKGKPPKLALAATMRKLLVILHRLLRDGTEFRWSTKQGQAA